MADATHYGDLRIWPHADEERSITFRANEKIREFSRIAPDHCC